MDKKSLLSRIIRAIEYECNGKERKVYYLSNIKNTFIRIIKSEIENKDNG